MVITEEGTKLYTWQQNQLSNGPAALNAKFWKEIEENEGSTIWSDRRVRLVNCIAQEKRSSNDKIGIKWEDQ